MATETIHKLAGAGRRTGLHRLPPRQLWQVPTFFVGLVALVTVGAAQPLLSQAGLRQVSRLLEQARSDLEQPRPDLDRVGGLVAQALKLAAPASPQAAEAHFLLGSAYVRRAEGVEGDAAVPFWQQARDHLEQAEHLGVEDADRARLAYRLGKVHCALNDDPQKIIDLLNWSIHEGADEPFEAYSMLAQAYLRLPTPDLQGALEATRKQLALPVPDDLKLAAPRLLCGELLQRLNQPEEARKVLARIGPSAPADILFKARYLRARLLQDDGAWAEAATLWEQVRSDPRWVDVKPARILYSLGVCYRKLDRLAEAARTWEATRLRGGEEAQAAALGLADVRLHGDQPAQALEAFEAALRNVNAPGDYHNSLVELADVRALFESAFQQLRQAEAFQEAVQLTALYEKIAPPGVAAQLGGEAAEAAALALRTAHSSSDDVARRKEEEARQLFRKAGLAFEASAAVATTPAQQMERLWRSITDYLEGRDHARAVEVLERYVRLPIPLERQGQAWYVLAEAYRTLRKPDARGAYEKCIEYPGPFAFRARYEIAVAKIEQKKFDDAEEDLRQNLQLMQTAPDPDAHEKTLVTLASLLYQQHNYSRAYDKLKEALERYPANPNAVRLRLQLAQCCRRRAEEVGERIGFQSSPGISSADEQRHLRAQRQGFLEEAAAHFQALVDNLETTQVQQKLTPEQENILGQARFAVADCRFDLGQYSQALFLFDVLAKRYEGQVEALIALQHVWQCHGVLFQAEEAKMTLERIRTAMAHTTYDGSAENRTHAWWEDWLAKQAKLREAARPNGR